MSAMSPERVADRAARIRQRGFSLVSAIFLLVVLAGLGGFMVSLSTMQQTTSALDVQGSRAYQAARAGIEWGAFRVMAPENARPFGAHYVCPVAQASMPALAGALSGFAVRLDCVGTVYAEGSNVITAYQLTSTATFGTAPSTDYVERRMRASIITCRTEANGPCP